MQLSPIERYALNFVEATGEAWTAESLRLAEAEIEAQKKEWEANRLATIHKQEEELQKMEQLENEGGDECESDDDVLLTYSRDDAMNQVNNRSNKYLKSRTKRTIVNKRLARVKEQEVKKNVKVRQLPQSNRRKAISPPKRKTHKRPVNISSSMSKTANGRGQILKKRKIDTTDRRVTRSSPTKTSPNKSSEKREVSSSSNSDGDDEHESGNEEHIIKNGEPERFSNQSDDETTMTECSLDVMLHDTTTNSTNYNKSDSENLSSKENPYSDYDEKDGDPLLKNKINLLDVNSPRTRSRGSVKINLWTLDESPILPSRSVIHIKKDSSQSEDIKDMASTPKNNKSKLLLSSSAGSPKKKIVNSNGKHKPPISTGNSSLIDRWVVKTPRTNSSPSPITGRRVTRLSSTFNNTS